MKFHVLHVLMLMLFICLEEICLGYKITDKQRDGFIEDMRHSIYGVGEQFMDDLTNIYRTYPSDSYIVDFFYEMITIGKISKEKNSKIDVNQMKDSYINRANAAEIAIKMDEVRILQSALSRQLPSERYNGMINLAYILDYPNATSKEIESALGYLYGTDDASTKTSFLNSHNFADPSATDCPDVSRKYSEAFDELKSMIDIKPKVVQDFTAIRENFPCNDIVLQFLSRFVYVIDWFGGRNSKINTCQIKEHPGMWDDHWSDGNSRDYMEYKLQKVESILLTRLPDETFRGILNFAKATLSPIDEIEKALEYLYDDVPKTNCSS